MGIDNQTQRDLDLSLHSCPVKESSFSQVYNEHIDDVGHDFGPDSQEIQKAIQDIDATIVYMLDRIEEMGMTDRGKNPQFLYVAFKIRDLSKGLEQPEVDTLSQMIALAILTR